MFRQVALAVGILFAGTTFAAAADLPSEPAIYKTPVAAPIAYTWTGIHIGVNGGHGFGQLTPSYSG